MSNKKIKYLSDAEVRKLGVKLTFTGAAPISRKLTDTELVNLGIRPRLLGHIRDSRPKTVAAKIAKREELREAKKEHKLKSAA